MSETRVINNLDEKQTLELETSLEGIKTETTKEKFNHSIRYCNWVNHKVNLHLKANRYLKDKANDEKKMHPIRPRRGNVYLAEMGQNVGSEINEQHLVLILQNNIGNIYSDTVIIIPISSSGKLYKTHEKIESKDIKDGRLDKLPSKAKTEQIHYLDKARLIHKVATLEDTCIEKICKRLKDNLCL